MAKNFALLQRYWQEWNTPLDTIVKTSGAGARLYFPPGLKEVGKENGLTIIKPYTPICIYDAPQKGSSKKRGPSHRLIIVIDGTFKLAAELDRPCLMGASCNVTFLSKTHESDDALRVKIIDALHFDVEDAENSTAFHPIFHAQRGLGTTSEACREVLQHITHGNIANIEVDLLDEDHVLSNPNFRLPTPQLDLFAVVTMVAADYFCNPNEKIKSTGGIERFRSVLNLLAHDKNLVMQGNSAMTLKRRMWGADNICAAHWYPELSA